jgi:hypothetical protein
MMQHTLLQTQATFLSRSLFCFPEQNSPLWKPISPTRAIGSHCNFMELLVLVSIIPSENFSMIRPLKLPLFGLKYAQLNAVCFLSNQVEWAELVDACIQAQDVE